MPEGPATLSVCSAVHLFMSPLFPIHSRLTLFAFQVIFDIFYISCICVLQECSVLCYTRGTPIAIYSQVCKNVNKEQLYITVLCTVYRKTDTGNKRRVFVCSVHGKGITLSCLELLARNNNVYVHITRITYSMRNRIYREGINVLLKALQDTHNVWCGK